MQLFIINIDRMSAFIAPKALCFALLALPPERRQVKFVQLSRKEKAAVFAAQRLQNR